MGIKRVKGNPVRMERGYFLPEASNFWILHTVPDLLPICRFMKQRQNLHWHP